MQHVYAAFFAGAITVVLAAIILYVDYGFWHEQYQREETLSVTSDSIQEDESEDALSPGDMIGSFFKDAASKLESIEIYKPEILDGKDTYTKEESVE
jgi:hypothetical protein